jgi:hypothetical protein
VIRKTLMAIALPFLIQQARAQADIRPFAGIGRVMENRIGFRGIGLSGGALIPISDHLTGIGQADLFLSNHVHGWNEVQNANASYRQLTFSARLQYATGEEPGTGLLLQAGMGIRAGSTYHYNYGVLHEGVITDPRYIKEKVKGSGFIFGIGYGFRINESLQGRIDLTDQAFLRINETYALTFSVAF